MLNVKFRPLIVAWLSVAAVAAATAGAPASAGVPGSTSSVNVDAQGVALGGYDPVAYFDGGTPTRGMDTISASYGGARYLFASAAHRKAFLRDPKKYVPEFGGFCAVGTSFGEKVDIDPQTGKVVKGKLYLNSSAKAQAIFDKDTSGTITRAEQKWPAVKDKPL
ncbi:MAG TPA: YHS domain-containing (seleno)protein [Steroidobacteraceae bacterium]|nr:YHS domain-containing (seleno)protein [Steroidobacteraceae bacterium]